MRLLAFYPYIPYPPNRGAFHRGFHLLHSLAEEHDVDLFALAEHGDGAQHKAMFESFCRHVKILPFRHPEWQKLIPKRLCNPLPSTVAHWTLPSVSDCLHQLLRRNEYDAVHVFDIVLAQYFLREHRNCLLVADRTRVDLQYQLMERRRMNFPLRTRILNWENLAKLWMYERAVAARAKLEIVCGPDDEQFVRRYIRRDAKLAVIPNGVDLDYFCPDAGTGEKRAAQPTVLFCGAMDYNPNIDALRWYFREMHDALRCRCPEVQVLIVGKNPTNEITALAAKPGVVVTGAVPDVRPYYRRAWIQIVPLRIGGGTRLKIVESLAMGTPVVSTSIGAQGLNLRHGHDILLADDTNHFLEQTSRALEDESIRQKLAQAGIETARRRLSWKSLGQKLCDVYRSVG